MKNGRPRPSAVRDYPERILRKEGGDPEARRANLQESVSRKETKESGQRKPTEGAAKSKPAIDKSGASLKSGAPPAENQAKKAEQRKAKIGNLNSSEDDEASKPPKPPKRLAVRDYPDEVVQETDRKLGAPKVDGPEAVEAKLQGDKRGPEAAQEDSKEKEGSRVDGTKINDSGKKPKVSTQQTSSAVKSPKVTKPSSSALSASKKKVLESDKTGSKGSELSSQNVTPKSGKRKTKSPTTSETKKRARLSGGKGPKPTSSALDGRNPRRVVIEFLRLYDAARRHYLHNEEMNPKQVKSRADLLAGSLMKDKGLTPNRGEKTKGTIPGIEVGDQFCFRMEISCLGMHGPIQGGIDYLTVKESEWNVPVAIDIISIVGQDSDNDDSGEMLVYAGQGGRSADNKQTDDQKLERGNLAMDGSKLHNVPVRVIRGIKDPTSPSGKLYTYDGLYLVEETKIVKGTGGYDEYRFILRRMPGQPQLGSYWIKEASKLRNQKPKSRENVVVEDISKGKESHPICVVNTVDDDKKSPAAFEYSTKIKYPNGIGKLESPNGCDCKGPCSTSNKCLCYSRNGDEFPYLNCGILVKEKDMIFECGSHCSCSSNCRNRLTNKGLKVHLEVFKTEDRGWGVRPLEWIPAGSFVCEYIGKLITDLESVSTMSEREHVLDLRRLPKNKTRWGDVSGLFTDSPPLDGMPNAAEPEIILDATLVGNVARFINHSCSPNLLVQKVLSEHQDVRYPQIKLFAMDNIPPMRELTFDYGCSVSDLGAEEYAKECLCTSTDCRGKLYY